MYNITEILSLFYFYSHCQWVDLKMANLPWEAPSHWVRPNKTADDIGKTYGVIYINNVNRNLKNNAAYAILYQKQFTKYLLPDLLKDSQKWKLHVPACKFRR